MSAIERLRKEAYELAPEFTISDEKAYLWTSADSAGHVLAAWDSAGNALATMRGTVALDREQAEEQLECSVALDASWFPTLILERGATSKQAGQRGLNSLLRLHFIEAAFGGNLSSLLGAVFDGAPRLGVLAEIGYDFIEPDKMWDPNIGSHSKVHLVALPRERMQSAGRILGERFSHALANFPWRDEPFLLAPRAEVARDFKALDANA